MLKGYIEGYYGRLFSQDERAKVINHMGKLKMDFYLYGPKEDLYHRIEWGKTYPAKEQKTLRSLVDGCKKNKLKPARQRELDQLGMKKDDAVYLSQFNSTTAGLSYDGSGDAVSIMLAECNDTEIKVLERVYLPKSLGHFYSAVCNYIGFDKFGEEYPG